MPKEPGPRCWAYSRHNRPRPGRVLFAKCAEDEIMILLFSVASITSGAYICRTREHLTIPQCAIESPSSRFRIANAVFSHDADTDALAFEAVSSMLIHFQALGPSLAIKLRVTVQVLYPTGNGTLWPESANKASAHAKTVNAIPLVVFMIPPGGTIVRGGQRATAGKDLLALMVALIGRL